MLNPKSLDTFQRSEKKERGGVQEQRQVLSGAFRAVGYRHSVRAAAITASGAGRASRAMFLFSDAVF